MSGLPAARAGLALALWTAACAAAEDRPGGTSAPRPVPVFTDRADRPATPGEAPGTAGGLARFLTANPGAVVYLDVFLPTAPHPVGDGISLDLADTAPTAAPAPERVVVGADPADAVRFAVVLSVPGGALLRGFYRVWIASEATVLRLDFVSENDVMLDPSLDYRFRLD